MPLSIITKGTMIVRDLDLLIAIAKRAELRVWSSITTVDAALARQLEPKAPSPAKRLEAIRRMRAAGLRSGVLLAPVIPGITDSEPAMRAVAEAAHSAGAVAFGSRPLKLDPGTKDVFYAFVAAQFPELLPRYLDRYGDGTKLDATYLRSLEARIERASAGLRFHDEPQRFSEPAQLQLAL
jgi:DNA repair photolyase